jgi:sodium-dependent dicarboxylate transporter 2/3/5
MAVFVGGCTSHSFTYQATGWAVLNKMGADYLPANAITPANIMFYDLPLLFVALLILYIVSKWYKPDKELGEITYFEEKLKEMGPISREEKWNALMLAILVVFIFTVSWHKLDINLGFAIIPWLVYLPGVNAATSDTIKKVNFPIVFFVMACMGIGVVASSLGLGQVFTAWIKMALNGSTSPFAIIAIIFAIVFALNFLMTPMAIFALIVAPVLALVTEMGFNAVPFALAINACSEAILFPYEYVPYLIVFAFGMISMKDFIKLNIMRSVVFFGGFLALLVPWWMLIGLL